MTIYLDIPHLERFGWIRVQGAVPIRLCERLVEVLEAEMGVPVHDQLRWHEYGGSRTTSSRSGDTRRNGIFVSILICTASGRHFGRPIGSGCGSMPAASHHPGGPVSPSRSASIGITIPGMRRCACFKAWWL